MDDNRVFKIDWDEKAIKKPEYYIGVSKDDFPFCAYCLAGKFNDQSQIILMKRTMDEKEFDEEVNNLAKYFNATILEER